MAILCAAVLTGKTFALEQDEVVQSQAQAIGIDEIEQMAEEYAPEIEWSGATDLDSELESILETGTASLNGVLKKSIRSGVLVLAVVLLSGIATGISSGGAGNVMDTVPIAATLAISAISVADTNALIGLGRETIHDLNIFSNVLLPAIAAATAATGAPGAAAARQAAAVLFSDILMNLINYLLMPIVYAYIATVIAACAVGNDGLKRISAMLKWLVTSLLTFVLLAFVGYLSVSGVIAGAADAIALKATKFTVSSMVPVVGGILSDAAETVLAGAGILKNTVGVFGTLVILSMCVTPFIQLGVHYLVYKMTAALSAMFSQPRITELINGIGGAFGLVLGMTGAGALILLITMVSAITLTGS